MEIGSRIYYDKITGDILAYVGERSGNVVETSIEDDIFTYKILSERNRQSFDYIQLEYGKYRQDFLECNGYRINPETLELEFSYPDPNIPPDEQEVIYQKPLSVKLNELNQKVQQQDAVIEEILFEILPGLTGV